MAGEYNYMESLVEDFMSIEKNNYKTIQISVVIPAYNIEKYIQECLDSVVSQENNNFEIICINDGSTDSTSSIIEKYVERYSNVFLYSQINKGLSASRNIGIELASGQYIYFLDGDDKLAEKSVLKKIVEYMNGYNLDLLECDAQSFYDNALLREKNPNYEKMYQRTKEYGFFERGKELLLKLYEANEYFCSSCIRAYRTSFLKDNQIYFKEGILYEDNLHTLESYLKAQNVMHKKMIVMKRRIREGSITQAKVSYHNFFSYIKVYLGTLELWNKCNSSKLETLFCELCDNYRQAIVNVYNRLNKLEKDRIGELEPQLQYHIKHDILNRIDTDFKYVFPYYLFKPGDHVMLYGAGNVGKTFYRIAIRDSVIHIDGIVDQRGDKASENDIHVSDLSEIVNHKDSKWLISIENLAFAEEAKKMLLSRGISQDCIFWNGIAYKKSYVEERLREQEKFVERLLRNKRGKKFYVFMQPEHGNIGDYAISLGEKEFFLNYFDKYDVIWVTANEWLYMKDFWQYNINKEDILFMNGGGYFGDIWPSGQICKEIVDCFPDNVKIFFPNTLTYKSGINLQNNQLQSDYEWLSNQSDLYVFFRDAYSFEYMREYEKVNCFYSPDMALYIEPTKEKDNNVKTDVLLCFRDDREKVFDGSERIKTMLSELGYNTSETDIHLNRYLSLEEGYVFVNRFIKQMQDYSLVITDRLHALILSVLAGVPCIATDNLTGKVSGVYPWVKDSIVKIIKDPKELTTELLNEMMSKKTSDYERPIKEFDEMAQIIKNIISERNRGNKDELFE